MYDDGVDIRDIQTGFDDGGGDQDVDLLLHEVTHQAFQFPRSHLAMGKCDPGIRQHFHQTGCDPGDIIHPVVYVVDLAFPGQLPPAGFLHQLAVIFHDIGLDRTPVHRRLLKQAHIPDPHQTHMQGPGNGSRRERQHIHRLPKLLDLLFMPHAEALLLIDHQEAEVMKCHVLGQQPVGPDHDVHGPFRQALQRLFRFLRRTEAGQHADIYGVACQPLDKGVKMLLCQNGGRHQVSHLPVVLYRLKCGTDRHFGLAEAHIPADQPVHDLIGFHIPLGILDGPELIVRLLIGEGLLKLVLPDRIRRILMSLLDLTVRIERHQFFRHMIHVVSDPRPGLLPLSAAELVQLRFCRTFVRIFSDDGKLVHGYEQLSSICIIDIDIVLQAPVGLNLLDPFVDTDAVALMDHIISRMEFSQMGDALPAVFRLLSSGPGLVPAQHLRLREHHQLYLRKYKSGFQTSGGDHDLSRLQDPALTVREKCRNVSLLQCIRKTSRSGL